MEGVDAIVYIWKHEFWDRGDQKTSNYFCAILCGSALNETNSQLTKSTQFFKFLDI